MTYRKAMLLSAAFSCVGCVWRDYQPNPPAQSIWVAPSVRGMPTMSAYLYQPDAKERAAIREAVAEVFDIYRDPDFQSEVRSFGSWMTRAQACDPANKHPITVGGDVLIGTIFERKFDDVHYLVHWFPNAIATTSAGGKHRGTAIRAFQVEKWSSSNVKVRAEFIDTVAHEITHLVRSKEDDPSDFSQAYQDDGHDECTERYLVSYRVGDLVGCFYRKRHGMTCSIAECMDTMRPVESAAACESKVRQIRASCE